LGIKVGDGETLAAYRVPDTVDVALVLAFVLEERRNWLYGESAPPIERLSMLANERSVALVTPDARLTWLCHPGPDAPAVFADLLGGPGAGHFSIKPHRNGLPLGQRYLPNTMTVETRWSRLLVTDYLEPESPSHRTDIVRVISGEAAAQVVFAPRPEFGGVPVKLVAEGEGLRVLGTSEPFVLRAPGIEWTITSDGLHDTATALVQPKPENPVVLELRCGTTDLAPHELSEIDRRDRAGRYWSDWAAKLKLPTVQTELVRRSALTLRGLVNTDTGGVLAAATTSLPEDIGGVRNWDYRYCWVRDATLTLDALIEAGCRSEAEAWMRWLGRAAAGAPEQLQIMYGPAGERRLTEFEVTRLPGYEGSKPVRVGNAASDQFQLDVYGELMDAVDRARGHGIETDDVVWQVQRALMDFVEQHWADPDDGIWEVRGPRRHFTHSRVMAWVAFDRAVRAVERHGLGGPVERWRAARDAV
ncbi:MAG: trehalase-like domain-containing protein, partial [Acidimicrobiales bacterium]